MNKICETKLPILNTEDLMVFDELGAYSLSLHFEFNGYSKPQVFWFLWIQVESDIELFMYILILCQAIDILHFLYKVLFMV